MIVLFLLLLLLLCIIIINIIIDNLRRKFSPGPGLEPDSPALRAAALTNWATQTIYWPKLEFFSY